MKRTLRAYILILASHFFIFSAHADPVKWDTLAEDIEISRVYVWEQSVISPELFLIRSKLQNYRLGVIRAADFGLRNDHVKSLSAKAKSILAINANFFDEYGKALGLVVSRGNQHQKIHRGGNTLTGIFQVTQNGIAIINREDFKSHLVTEALQAGPRLLVNGLPTEKLRSANSYTRRAGICIDSENRIVFFISSGLMGISLSQIQEILTRDGIKCVDALNFDGGGSAQLYLSNKLELLKKNDIQDFFIPGRDNIPIALGLFKKDNSL